MLASLDFINSRRLGAGIGWGWSIKATNSKRHYHGCPVQAHGRSSLLRTQSDIPHRPYDLPSTYTRTLNQAGLVAAPKQVGYVILLVAKVLAEANILGLVHL